MKVASRWLRHVAMSTALVAIACDSALAAPTVLVTQGSTLYRFQSSASIETFVLTDAIRGMTTVPPGMTVGNLNGGASGGDALALGQWVYRIDDALEQ